MLSSSQSRLTSDLEGRADMLCPIKLRAKLLISPLQTRRQSGPDDGPKRKVRKPSILLSLNSLERDSRFTPMRCEAITI